MEELIKPLWVLFELFTIVILGQGLLSPRSGKFWPIVAFAVIYATACARWLADLSPFLFLLANILVTTLLLFLVFSGPAKHTFLCALLGHLAFFIIDCTSYALCYCAGELLHFRVSTSSFLSLFFSTVGRVAALLVVGKRYAPQRKWPLLTLLLPSISLIALISLFPAFHYRGLFIPALLTCSLFALLNICIFSLLHSFFRQRYPSVPKASCPQPSLRHLNHEFMHQVQTIDALLAEDNVEEAKAYLQQIQADHSTQAIAVQTGSPIVSAILNQKYQAACRDNIDMQIYVSDLSGLCLPANDLVILLTNLLDNALEACLKLPGERQIHCRLEVSQIFYLSIRNTSAPVVIEGTFPKTTKEMKDEHGLGLPNVCRVLDTLSAEYAFAYQDGWFHFAAEIPLTK